MKVYLKQPDWAAFFYTNFKFIIKFKGEKNEQENFKNFRINTYDTGISWIWKNCNF